MLEATVGGLHVVLHWQVCLLLCIFTNKKTLKDRDSSLDNAALSHQINISAPQHREAQFVERWVSCTDPGCSES